MLNAIEAVLRSTLDYAPSLLFTALGAAITERSGVINLGLEGMMRAGAFLGAAVAYWTGSPWTGLVAGALAGGLVAWLLGWLCIRWRSDQVVTGIALNLVALAGITFVVEAVFGSSDTPAVRTLPRLHVPLLDRIPILRALDGHCATSYLAALLPLALHVLLYKTPWGLRVRAVGEKPQAVASLGLSVSRLRYAAVVASGLLSGLGGATLSLAVLDHFNDLMPFGQGFVALAAMVFGKWTPLGAAGAAAFFAFADALRIGTSSTGLAVPKGVMLALPYALSLVVLAGFVGRAVPPAADGRPYDPEMR